MRFHVLSVAVSCVLFVLAGCSQEGAKSLPEPVGDTPTSTGPTAGSLSPNHPPIDISGAAPDAAADRRLPPGVQNPMAEIMALKARVETNPADVEALIALGNANMMISRFEVAQDLYSRALAIQPKNLDVRTSLAIAYQYGGKSDQALAELKQNLRHDAKHDATLFNLGFLYHDVKKDPAAAREVWARWLRWYPNAPAAADIGRRVAAIESAIGKGGDVSRK